MSTKKKWIEKGYEHFALYGPNDLSINKISKEIDSPRASFYHHFGDIEMFIDKLLDLHMEIAIKYIGGAAEKCQNLFPDVYLLLEQFPIPLKFNRQLFLNRSIPKYNFLFVKTYNISANKFMVKLFAKEFGLKNNRDTHDLWIIVGESWYSRIDVNNLTTSHMQQVAEEVLSSVMKFIGSDLYSKIQEPS